MKKAKLIKTANQPKKSKSLTSLLKKGGFILPATEEELEEYDKIHTKTDIILPLEVDSPDFLFKETSLEKDFVDQQIVTKSFSMESVVPTKDSDKGNSLTPVKSFKRNDYFKKLVLAAEIAYQLYLEPTFGRTKFVKILYLCEHLCQMQLSTNYGKYAAGPFDPKFIYSVEAEFKKRKWFQVIKTDSRTKYQPSTNVDSYRTYFSRYYQKQSESIFRVIELFRHEKTDFCEIVATLFAVWQEELFKNKIVTNDILINKFYSWSKQKEKFSEPQVLCAIEWMKNEQITPSFFKAA